MEKKKKRTSSRLIALIVLVLLIAGLILFLQRTGFFASVRSIEDVRAYIERFSPYSYGIYFLIQFASIIVAPIPSNVTSLAGAALFGTVPAFLLTYAAVAIGAVLVFQLARILGRPFVEKFVSKRDMEKYLDIIQRKQDVFFALAFLFPGFPDDILCFLAGLSSMPLKRFVLLVLLCRPWGLLVSCAVGGNALSLPLEVMVLLCVIGAAVFIIAMKYGDKWEAKLLQKIGK